MILFVTTIMRLRQMYSLSLVIFVLSQCVFHTLHLYYSVAMVKICTCTCHFHSYNCTPDINVFSKSESLMDGFFLFFFRTDSSFSFFLFFFVFFCQVVIFIIQSIGIPHWGNRWVSCMSYFSIKTLVFQMASSKVNMWALRLWFLSIYLK